MRKLYKTRFNIKESAKNLALVSYNKYIIVRHEWVHQTKNCIEVICRFCSREIATASKLISCHLSYARSCILQVTPGGISILPFAPFSRALNGIQQRL